MKSSVTGAVAVMSFGLVYAGLAAEQIGPRMSDSTAAQRDRSLSLINGPIRSSEELAKAKERMLTQVREAHHAALAVLDAQMREANGDEEKLSPLRARRDAMLKTLKELEDKIERRIFIKSSGF